MARLGWGNVFKTYNLVVIPNSNVNEEGFKGIKSLGALIRINGLCLSKYRPLSK